MSSLLARVATEVFSEGPQGLRRSMNGPLCLAMLARRMNELDTGPTKTVIFTFTKDNRLQATLAGRAMRRYEASEVTVSAEEFEELLLEHFNRPGLTISPLHVRDWREFGECLDRLQRRARSNPQPSHAPESGFIYRHSSHQA